MDKNHDITVLCVFWDGPFRGRPYRKHWVQKLQAMVERNLDYKFNFICLSNHYTIPGVKSYLLRDGNVGWWAKLECFRKELPGDRFLYLDLDLLVLQSLKPFVDFPAPMGIVPAFGSASQAQGTVHGYNSSVMVWDREEGLSLYEKFSDEYTKMLRGDQDFIKVVKPDIATFPKNWVTKIRYCHKGEECNPPTTAKILLCMPYKNNEAVKRFPWMKEVWYA